MDKSCVSAFSDTINADNHSHWMLQLFYAFNNDLLIDVNGDEIRFRCVILNSGVVHNFATRNSLCFTMLIDPSSSLSLELKKKYLQDKEYHLFDEEMFLDFNLQFKSLPQMPIDIQLYENFTSELYHVIGITIQPFIIYDERILDVIKHLETCDFSELSIKELAQNLALSPSRLSHLFKEQTGIPLKSFILIHMMQRAYTRILQTGDITSAALDAGFDSPSHFAATSKRLMGMSATGISKDSVFLKASFI